MIRTRAVFIATSLTFAVAAAHAADWSVAPDVIPTVATQPADVKPSAAQIATDLYRIKPNLTMNPTFADDRDLIVPTRPSKYVLTLGGFRGGFELWDLKTGAQEKSGKGRIDLRKATLSPDGQYIAGYKWGAGVNEVQVWSLKTGQLAAHIETGKVFEAKVLGFVGNDRAATLMTYMGAPPVIRINELASGSEVKAITLEKGDEKAGMTFSATGKFIALARPASILLLDTTTGQSAGKVDLGEFDPSAKPGWGPTPDSAAAFSPSGQEFAVAQVHQQKLRVVIVSVSDGHVIESKTTDLKTPRAPEGETLHWSPDAALLLLGDTVIDRKSLTAVYQLPKREKLFYTRWTDSSGILQIFPQDKHVTFETVTLTKDLIAKAQQAVTAGGKTEDTAMAPLTPVDLSQAAAIRLSDAPAEPWSIQPAAVPARKTLAPFFNLKPAPENAPNTEDRALALLFTSNAANAIFVEHAAVARMSREVPFNRGKAHIQRHDLATGSVTAELDEPAALQVLDASDTGKSLAFRGGADVDRLEVWTADKATFKPTLAIRPFGTAKFDVTFRRLSGNSIAWAGLVDDTHVLTMSAARQLACFEVPTGKALWSADLKPAGARDEFVAIDERGDVPTFSPDRKLAAISIGSRIALFDPLTGKAVNSLGKETPNNAARSPSFSPDGAQLALIYGRGDNSQLQVFSLKNGALLHSIPIPWIASNDPVTPITFVAPDYLLLANGYLVNLEKKAIARHYQFPAGDLRRGTVNSLDRLVYAAERDGKLPPAVINITLPDDAAKKAVASLSPDDLYLWHPGMKVKLDITVVGDDAYKQKQIDAWKTRLKELGIEVDDNSPNILRANSFFMAGQPTIYDVRGEKVTVNQQLVGHDILLTVNGQEAWKSVHNKPPEYSIAPPVIFLEIKQGETPQQAADRQNPQPKETSSIVAPPPYIFKERKIDTVRLTRQGPEEPPTRAPR